jgi:hypothetical protein
MTIGMPVVTGLLLSRRHTSNPSRPEQDHVGDFISCFDQSFFTGSNTRYLITFPCQIVPDKFQDIFFVVDYKNFFFGHGPYPSFESVRILALKISD